MIPEPCVPVAHGAGHRDVRQRAGVAQRQAGRLERGAQLAVPGAGADPNRPAPLVDLDDLWEAAHRDRSPSVSAMRLNEWPVPSARTWRAAATADWRFVHARGFEVTGGAELDVPGPVRHATLLAHPSNVGQRRGGFGNGRVSGSSLAGCGSRVVGFRTAWDDGLGTARGRVSSGLG